MSQYLARWGYASRGDEDSPRVEWDDTVSAIERSIRRFRGQMNRHKPGEGELRVRCLVLYYVNRMVDEDCAKSLSMKVEEFRSFRLETERLFDNHHKTHNSK